MDNKLALKDVLLLMAEECSEIIKAHLLKDLDNICIETRDLISVALFLNQMNLLPDKISLKYSKENGWVPPSNMLEHIDSLYPIIINELEHLLFKTMRFGLDSFNPNDVNKQSNLARLIQLFEVIIIYINVLDYKYSGFYEMVYDNQKIIEKQDKVLFFNNFKEMK